MTHLKYLVRSLTIRCGDVEKSHKLTYIILDMEGDVVTGYELAPFDRERHGFEYLDSLTVSDGKILFQSR